jgi:phage tail sheath gpL-like
LAWRASLNPEKLMHGKLKAQDWPKLAESNTALYSTQVWFDDSPDPVAQLENAINTVTHQANVKLDQVILYLSGVKSSSEIPVIYARCKRVALAKQVLVIVSVETAPTG